MAEVGIDVSQHVPRQVSSVEIAMADLVVTLCDKTRGGCPVIPPGVRHVALSISDPSGLDPDQPDDLIRLRQIRAEIQAGVEGVLNPDTV